MLTVKLMMTMRVFTLVVVVVLREELADMTNKSRIERFTCNRFV